MNSSSLSDPASDRMPVPYKAVPIDILERQASDCETKAANLTLPVHEAENLLRQAKQSRAAIALEHEHRAGCEPYSLGRLHPRARALGLRSYLQRIADRRRRDAAGRDGAWGWPMTKEQFIQMLRDAAQFLESKPELPKPDCVFFNETLELIYVADCGAFRADTPEGVAQFAKIVGGKLTKFGNDTSFGLEANRGTFTVKTSSHHRENFCERVQVGTKVEPEHIIPEPEEEVVPEREVRVYE